MLGMVEVPVVMAVLLSCCCLRGGQQILVLGRCCKKLLAAAVGQYAAMIHDQDAVARVEVLEVVRNDEHRARCGEALEQMGQGGPGHGIKIGVRLVHEDDVGVAEQHSGPGDSLSLAAGESDSGLAQVRVKTEILLPQQIGETDVLKGLVQGGVRVAVAAEFQILSQRAGEHDRVLTDEGEASAVGVQVELVDR